MIDGFAKKHLSLTEDLFNYISKVDFEQCNDYFCFKSGGDGDNGEILMDEIDDYFANVSITDSNDICKYCKTSMCDYFCNGQYFEGKKMIEV